MIRKQKFIGNKKKKFYYLKKNYSQQRQSSRFKNQPSNYRRDFILKSKTVQKVKFRSKKES